MKNLFLFLAIIIIILPSLSSCSRMSYSYGGSAAGCTAWYPKKFKANPKPIRPVKGPSSVF
jgi:hypothetical protein